MTTRKPREADMPSHTVINDRYVHGVIEKITATGFWLKDGKEWHKFNQDRMRGQTMPRPGAYVVATRGEGGLITHIATQHELQQPPEPEPQESVSSYPNPVGDPRISDTDEAYFEAERKRIARQLANASYDRQNPQPNTATTQPTPQSNTAIANEIADNLADNVDSLVSYRIRTDALALAARLLELELHYGIDRDDIYRVAREVVRWIQEGREE